MKKILYIAFFSCLAIPFSCSDKESKGKENTYRPDSVGRINGLQIVISNELWNGDVGEKVREYFAALTLGLPQQEPIFSISQMVPEAHTGFARNTRTFLYLQLADGDMVSLKKDPYARPQVGAFIKATSEEKMMQLLDENHERIVKAFKANEIKERQRRTNVSPLKVDSLQERFGVSLKIPSAYRVAAASDQFYWIRKDLKDGTTNILIYEVPLYTIQSDSTAVGDIIKMRNTIGSRHLPVEEDGLFITEKAYAPYLSNGQIDGKFAYETKGTWEVQGELMAGPFINYAVYDEANNRYLILEGFTYAPSVEKRDLQFELESILKSANIK